MEGEGIVALPGDRTVDGEAICWTAWKIGPVFCILEIEILINRSDENSDSTAVGLTSCPTKLEKITKLKGEINSRQISRTAHPTPILIFGCN